MIFNFLQIVSRNVFNSTYSFLSINLTLPWNPFLALLGIPFLVIFLMWTPNNHKRVLHASLRHMVCPVETKAIH